jgi:hypothetical protein
MNISIQTTADRMIVRDLDTGEILDWVDSIHVEYASPERRTILYLGTYEDSTIKVVSAPFVEPAPTPTPEPTPTKPPGK